MIRKKKRFSRPRKAYDKTRIDEENKLVNKYGLKNKREIWKADAKISRVRDIAKKLITAEKEEQEKLFNKLKRIGFNVSKIADVLDLNKEDWLKRRLQSVLIIKKMAKPKEARQLIAHKHVSVGSRIINIPSYIVKIEEEGNIKIKRKQPVKKSEIIEQIKEEAQ